MRAHEFSDQGAAGIILYAEDTRRYGLQQRSDNINDGGLWAAWGGGREPGETLEQCAVRELAEESGYSGSVKLKKLAENSRYVTFIGVVPHEFEPRPDSEWKDYCWVEAGDWPSPMHPGVAAALRNIPEQLDELSFLGSECTYDCSGHRAGYAWYHRNQRDPLSWSPSFNKGAALAKAGK